MEKNTTNEFGTKYGIDIDVCKGLDIMGYHHPMPVQEEVIEHVLDSKDLIVQSKTGSGKTAAFGIPIVDHLTVEENLPQVLVLTPTRELAVQVCEEIANIGKYKKIRCLPIYGKQPIHIQLRQLKQRVHVAVGTPGRVSDLIKKKHLKLDAIKYLVIDEADELLKRGFIEEVEGIIKKIPDDRTTLLFSATMPTKIEEICTAYMQEPERIEIASDEAPIDQIKQTYYEVADDWKFKLLTGVLQELKPESCMIFCNTRTKVEQLTKRLSQAKYPCTALHGKMAQKYRLRAISDFKNGKYPFMIATDLAGRGIHIDNLNLVINYNIPVEDESYVHRIGRTGRVGEKGMAISFVSPHDKKRWQEIQDYIGYQVPKGSDDLLTNDNTSKGKGNNQQRMQPRRKAQKDSQYKDITRIRINAGKKKKIRPGDLLGAISNLPGIKSEDIGIIDIQDTCSYVEIFNDKGQLVARELSKSKVKGKSVTVKKVR
ncbi:DEAD/DEAH box helicase [Vallitalea okinawensis]|uniref:DEAD/DEAH box helicase n=1 Tax=Vallitalea okinawensis TaxID=2078660 RepID=UPI000CFB25A2|nr:DEAD/DEAH box helicase [Vallitalea okinawensis]